MLTVERFFNSMPQHCKNYYSFHSYYNWLEENNLSLKRRTLNQWFIHVDGTSRKIMKLASKHICKYEAEADVLSPLEFMYAMHDEISRIVNRNY